MSNQEDSPLSTASESKKVVFDCGREILILLGIYRHFLSSIPSFVWVFFFHSFGTSSLIFVAFLEFLSYYCASCVLKWVLGQH